MDELLRRFERAGMQDDPLMAARAIRDRLRAELLTPERLELLAHIRHEPARLALGAPELKPLVEHDDVIAWWRQLARFGREVAVRCAIGLVRPHLFENLQSGWRHDRFSGISEEAWHAVEALDDWVKKPTDASVDALRAAVTTAVEAPEPDGGVGIFPPLLSLISVTSVEEGLLNIGEGLFNTWRPFDTLLGRMRHEVVPWVLGERDPIATRDHEEGRHFGVDPDISRSVSYSRDGLLVLSTSRGGSVKVRDATTGAMVRDFHSVRGEVFSAAFSPDGTKVLAAGQWRPTRLLDVATGSELQTFDHKESVQDVAFVDEARVLTAGDDKTLRLWDVATGKELRAFEGHERQVSNVLVLPGGRAISTSGETVHAWDVESGSLLATWKQQGSIESVALAPDGTRLLVGVGGGRARLIRLEDGAEERVFESKGGSVYGLAFLPDGTRFISVCSSRGTYVNLWDVASGEVLKTWDVFHALAFNVAVAPDGQRFILGDREGGLRSYRI